VSDRAAFLAGLRATPRGEDRPLPLLDEPPDAPSELRPGEDPVQRFRAEAAAVATELHAVATVDTLATAVLAILREEGAVDVALADDLGDQREAIDGTLRDAGIAVAAYDDVAADRARAGALDATVTGCLAAVAATGSIVTSAAAGRSAALIAPVHVCVVPRGRIVSGLHALLDMGALSEAGSLFALQSGPSRSADIEKTLILGVHGPARVHVVIVG